MADIPRPDPEQVRSNGTKRLRLLGKDSLSTVLDIAVSRALRRQTAEYDTRHVTAVQRIVKQEFSRLVKDNARSIRALPKSEFLLELERSRNQILEARDRAQLELDELEERSGLLRDLLLREDKHERGQISVRGQRLEEEFTRRFEPLLARSVVGPAARKRLLDELVASAGSAVLIEWRQSIDERRRNATDEIERYERRILKLTQSLERTEAALHNLSNLKEGDAGIASIYRTVQGLAAEEDDRERKQEMLSQIFEANVALHQALAVEKAGA